MAQYWWLWMVAGLALAIVEVIIPGWVFLGFAMGALGTGLVLLLLPGFGLAFTWLLFAGLSLLAWVVLRQVFGTGGRDVKIWTRDINED
jgi:inner membrane protein